MVGKILKKTRSILFASPKLLYRNEKHLVNKTFYFKGKNKKAVLLLHGWTATPYELRRLGVFLNEAGYTVYGPMLRGHGTKPEDLENVKYEDWIGDASDAYQKLRRIHKKVFVGGTSMGGTIALCLAKKFNDIDGLILMATPYKIKMEKIVNFVVFVMSFFKKYKKKVYPPTFGSRKTITRIISYQTYPIKNVMELDKLVRHSRKDLGKIKQPFLIMQSSSDHIVAKNSLRKIYKQIGSDVKKKKYIKRSYHTFISDIKNEHIFKDILSFLESI